MIAFQKALLEIEQAREMGEKLLSVLIDPDKFEETRAKAFLKKLPETVSHLFVGGSSVAQGRTDEVVRLLKSICELPIILFPGDHSQITEHADAILFLSLISGSNPEFLIEQQVRSVARLKNSKLEIIPTGYILIDGGKECAVHRVSGTKPLPQHNIENIVNVALAGQYSGKKLIYLEAGSGAKIPVSEEIIRAVKENLEIPLIVGGGIRSEQDLKKAYAAGADLVVVGTAFEKGNFQS